MDGFRLDAVRYFFETGPGAGQQQDQPETHAFLKRIRAALQARVPAGPARGRGLGRPGRSSPPTTAHGDEVQLAFAFDQADAAAWPRRQRARATTLVNSLAVTEATLGGKDRGFDAPFLSNHDQVRVARAARWRRRRPLRRRRGHAASPWPGRRSSTTARRSGCRVGPAPTTRTSARRIRWNATAPGVRLHHRDATWYGATTEAAGVDVATQRADPASLWNLYRSLIALRHARRAAARTGDTVRPAVTGGGPGALALLRSAAGEADPLRGQLRTAAAIGALAVDVAAAPPRTLLAEGLAGAAAVDGRQALRSRASAPDGFAFVCSSTDLATDPENHDMTIPDASILAGPSSPPPCAGQARSPPRRPPPTRRSPMRRQAERRLHLPRPDRRRQGARAPTTTRPTPSTSPAPSTSPSSRWCPSGDTVEFRVTVKSRIEDPWDSAAWGGNGFSVQMVFIHIDTDHVKGSGVRDGLPGLNVRFAEDEAWDKVVIISPQGPTRVNSEIELKCPQWKDRIIVPKLTRAQGRTLIAVVDVKAHWAARRTPAGATRC